MNVFILTDLEGISGVNSIDHMERGSEKYQYACQRLCQSINLATEACFKAGAEKVYYLDGHGGGGNVIEDRIDSRAVKCTIQDWEGLLQEGKIDCQIELGAHARAGTVNGFLDHTLSSRSVFAHKINGIAMSELSIHALFCAAYRVPVVACIGDEAACRQAQEYIPDIYVGAVKKASERNRAVDVANADGILTDTILHALKNYDKVSLYQAAMPMKVEVTYYRTDMCEEIFKNCGAEVSRTDARTLEKTVEKVKTYYDLRF